MRHIVFTHPSLDGHVCHFHHVWWNVTKAKNAAKNFGITASRLRVPYGVPGIWPESAPCKTSASHSIISLTYLFYVFPSLSGALGWISWFCAWSDWVSSTLWPRPSLLPSCHTRVGEVPFLTSSWNYWINQPCLFSTWEGKLTKAGMQWVSWQPIGCPCLPLFLTRWPTILREKVFKTDAMQINHLYQPLQYDRYHPTPLQKS